MRGVITAAGWIVSSEGERFSFDLSEVRNLGSLSADKIVGLGVKFKPKTSTVSESKADGEQNFGAASEANALNLQPEQTTNTPLLRASEIYLTRSKFSLNLSYITQAKILACISLVSAVCALFFEPFLLFGGIYIFAMIIALVILGDLATQCGPVQTFALSSGCFLIAATIAGALLFFLFAGRGPEAKFEPLHLFVLALAAAIGLYGAVLLARHFWLLAKILDQRLFIFAFLILAAGILALYFEFVWLAAASLGVQILAWIKSTNKFKESG